MNNNQKATKRALLTSVMALVMCVVMLVGTTFAWFTDTASTGVNKIVSGNLKVDIIGANSDDHIEKLNFTKAGTEVGTDAAAAILWEPGCRYVTEGFRIANKGNLALKWKAQVNKGTTAANEGNFDLLDVIDFYLVTKAADGTETETALDEFTGNLKKTEISNVYYIKGVMQTTAGNDYQGLTLDGIGITVYATQDTVEKDSYGPEYDGNAEYPIDTWNGDIATAKELADATDDTKMVVTVDSGKLLAALAQSVNEGKDYSDYTIKLTKNIDLNGIEWAPIGTKGTSNVFKGIFDGNGATISNLKISGGSYVALFGETSGATIKDLTVTGEVSGEDVAGIVAKATGTTITNCVSKVNVTATAGKAAGISASFGGTITKCENRGTVATAAAQPAGGLVAWCNAAVIESCHNYGAVTAGDHGALDSAQAGGLCGNLAAGSTIKNCSNSAVITSANLAGGVAGRAGAENKTAIVVEKFTNTGAIKGTYAAGIIADAKNVSIKESNVSGTVSGTNAAGGIFGTTRGNSQSAVKDCAINANVTATTANRAGQVAGILGGKVELKLNESTANDIGCFKGATLTITGTTPNNIDFSEIVDGSRSNPGGFVHENIGLTETIIIDNVTYYYRGTATDPYYTWSVTNS